MLLGLLLMAFCMAGALASPARSHIIQGEFIIRLDEAMIHGEDGPTGEDSVARMIRELEMTFDVAVIEKFKLGPLRLLHVATDWQHVQLIKDIAWVKYAEPNARGFANECRDIPAPGVWGLDRTEQRGRLSYSDPLSANATYAYGGATGAGVTAYVADSGVDLDNPEFGGRVRLGYKAPITGPGEDGLGHGTHCAGTIGSVSYGLAKDVDIVDVKILNRWGWGPENVLIGGLEWIMADHAARSRELGAMAKSVVNMSLGYRLSDALNDAMRALWDAGIVPVVAAGNEDQDACLKSPARSKWAITVGASTVNDFSASFSSYGSCVDIYAAGEDVLSTVPRGLTEVKSGTSMATPHVVGAIALFQSSLDVAPSPAEVMEHLLSTATADALEWARPAHSTSSNLLLYAEC